MSWANCGRDSKDRPIGYAIRATCDHDGCEVMIDRGLAYACGGMHGTGTLPATDFRSCEGYFCEQHKTVMEIEGEAVQLCMSCAAKIPEIEEAET